jgi:hypothetical protein
MSLSEAEFRALRETIATRGTVRIILFPTTLAAWSIAAVTLLLLGPIPIGALFPLAILVSGFEAVHALHVGAERIGRYLQVFYEGGSVDGPRWETTAMAVGPALPGGGIDPLFTIVFASATVLNAVAALLPRPTPVELAAVGALHGAFLVRIARARIAAARQRAVELESYRALQNRG